MESKGVLLWRHIRDLEGAGTADRGSKRTQCGASPKGIEWTRGTEDNAYEERQVWADETREGVYKGHSSSSGGPWKVRQGTWVRLREAKRLLKKTQRKDK